MPSKIYQKHFSVLRRGLAALTLLLTAEIAARGADGPPSAQDDTLARARDAAEKIAAKYPGVHARALRREEKKLNAAGSHTLYDRYLVFDAEAFDVMRALGVPAPDAARRTLAAQGHESPSRDAVEKIARSFSVPGFIADGFAGPLVPAVLPMGIPDPANRACIVVLSSPHDPLPWDTTLIYDMKPASIRAHLNAVARNTCTGTAYRQPGPDEAGLKPADAEARLAYKRHVLAEVTAAGEAVRKGNAPLSGLDNLGAWRAVMLYARQPGDAGAEWEPTEDKLHYSTAALRALRSAIDGIEGMGLKAFRALGPAKAGALYRRAADKGAVSGESLARALAYIQGPAGRVMDEGSYAATRESSSIIIEHGLAREPHGPSSDRASAACRLGIENWDPTRILMGQAFHRRGRVTPETLTEAYQAVLRKIDDRRAPPFPCRELAEEKLRTVFTGMLDKTNFTAETAARGLKIPARGGPKLRRHALLPPRRQ